MNSSFISSKDIKKEWKLVDARGLTLGKLSSTVAHYLRGKHKPSYTPNMDDGDYVIVINAKGVVLTGNKLKDKKYYKHTGFVGSIKSYSYDELMKKKPEFVVKKAVKGMLSNNRLGRRQLSNLKVYAGAEHKHNAQQPALIKVV